MIPPSKKNFIFTQFQTAILIVVLFLCTLLLPNFLAAQSYYSIDTQRDYYYRLLQISGQSNDPVSFLIRPFQPDSRTIQSNPWRTFSNYNPTPFQSFGSQTNLYLYNPEWFQSINSGLPRGLNDGPVWQGKGYNSAISFGFKANYGPLHIKFRPVLGIAQNVAYDLGPYPISVNEEFAYRLRPDIDYVQRFGNSTYSWGDLGDSYVDLRYRGWHAGVSNSRLWAGPATLYPLLFSYQGPGFLHGFVGTYRPLNTPIGHVEFRYVYGGVKTSDYFTTRSGNNLTSVNALIFAYSPSFIKGLSIGGQRLYMEQYPHDLNDLWRQISKIWNPVVREGLQTDENPRGWEPDNQLITVFARWVFPKSGFEFYTEFGRNDHNADFRDLRMQPDHMRAYVFGLIKSIPLSNQRLLALNLEWTQTESTRTAYTRGLGTIPPRYDDLGLLGSWYTHAYQTVGFSNKGQPIGSGFGPGGNAQNLKADYYFNEGKYGVRLSRLVYHNTLLDNVSRNRNYYEQIIAENPGIQERWRMRNIEYVIAFDATRSWKYGLEVSAAIEQSIILNQHYLSGNDVFNTRLELTLRKKLKGGIN